MQCSIVIVSVVGACVAPGRDRSIDRSTDLKFVSEGGQGAARRHGGCPTMDYCGAAGGGGVRVRWRRVAYQLQVAEEGVHGDLADRGPLRGREL